MSEYIHVDSLTKVYRSFRKNVNALKGVSFSVQGGEIFSLIGPNGAGKTTLVKIITGLVLPTSGRCTVIGKKLTDPSYRVHIGYVPELHDFPQFYNARRVLTFLGKLQGMGEEELPERIDSVLHAVKLKNWYQVPVRKYSKGMKQRLAMAQALLHRPDILILDEPTDGIDPIGRIEIRDILLKLRDEGLAILINSHLLSEVEMVADKIAILDKGNILKIGTLEELKERKDEFVVTFKTDETEKIDDLSREYSLVREGTSWMCTLGNGADAQHFIDILRKHKITIEEYKQSTFTLEDYFINQVDNDSLLN